jgi:hypothetical protein
MLKAKTNTTRFSNDHVMIDIETLSTKNNARILTISAVKFNLINKNETPETQSSHEFQLELLIDQEGLSDEEKKAFDVDKNTMKWWEEREPEIYEYNFKKEPRIKLEDALKRLNEFTVNSKHYWCQGMNFDPVILEHAYTFYNIKPNWKFYDWRDSRTVIKLLYDYIPPNSKQNNHKSIDDCINQIQNLKKVTTLILKGNQAYA